MCALCARARAPTQVKILRHMHAHGDGDAICVIPLMEHFVFRNHLCLAFPLLSINLYEFIKGNNFQGTSLALIRRFAGQILACLQFLKRHRIIHCDMKPEVRERELSRLARLRVLAAKAARSRPPARA